MESLTNSCNLFSPPKRTSKKNPSYKIFHLLRSVHSERNSFYFFFLWVMLTLYFWNILKSFLDQNIITATRKITQFIKMEKLDPVNCLKKLLFAPLSRLTEVQTCFGICLKSGWHWFMNRLRGDGPQTMTNINALREDLPPVNSQVTLKLPVLQKHPLTFSAAEPAPWNL